MRAFGSRSTEAAQLYLRLKLTYSQRMATAEAGRNDVGSRSFSVGGKVPEVACFPSRTSPSGGDVEKRKRRRVAPTDEREQLELLRT